MDVNLHKISEDVYAILFVLLTCLAGGFLFILVYFPSLFNALENFRLSLIALGVTMPLIIINGYCMLIIDEEVSGFNAVVSTGAVVTILVVYIPIILGFFWNLSSKVGVGILVTVEILLFILSIFGIARRLLSDK